MTWFRNWRMTSKLSSGSVLICLAGFAAGRAGYAALAPVAIVALVLGWALARSYARPLGELKEATSMVMKDAMPVLLDGITALSQDDLTRAYHIGMLKEPTLTYVGTDELGQATQAVRLTIGQIGACLRGYEQARIALERIVHHVRNSSEQVDHGANELAQATQQIGQASTQIARAIEDVARGASEQSKGVTEMSQMVSELDAAVRQVAEDAAQQAATAGPLSVALQGMSAALVGANESLGTVTQAATQASQTAQDGGQVIDQTVTSIGAVRNAMQQSAEQVEALGQRSAEIGQIVEAIDDIAAQTNLLALNAAIEAARAGEHGKGFTVVAAEVRKLAERSSNETKEIAGHIRSIQQQVGEVVAAMHAASAAVTETAQLGEQTKDTLQNIVKVVDGTRSQVQSISAVTEEMGRQVGAVNEMALKRNQIAEATRLATEVMAARCDHLSHSIESMAAVSEESAASAEEVSASTQEQTAGVEQMSAGAQELAALAQGLEDLVEHFTVDGASATPEAAATQRAHPARVA